MGDHEHALTRCKVRDNCIKPVGHHARNNICKALRGGQQLRWQLAIARIIIWVELILCCDLGRRHIVTTPPDLDLLCPVLRCGLRLICASEFAVVTLVESPTPPNWNPKPLHRVERNVCSSNCTHLQRGMQEVGREAGLGHHRPGSSGLGTAMFGQVAVIPASKQVEFVPLALAMAEQYKLMHGGLQCVRSSCGLAHTVLVDNNPYY